MPYRQKGQKKFHREGLPYVVTKSAQTLDGKIATLNGDSKWITSEASRRYARRERDHFDAILVGAHTLIKDDPRLNGVSKRKFLKKIVLDTSLRTPLGSNIFKGMPPRSCIIATTRKASKKRIREFEHRGIIVIVCPVKKDRVDLKWLARLLVRNGVFSILIEGGARAIGFALEDKLVDEMHFYVAPRVLGDERALSSVIGRSVKSIGQTIGLKFVKVRKIGTDIQIINHVLRHR